MTRHLIVTIFAFCPLAFASARSWAGEPTKPAAPPVRVAVLDFQCPQATPWLGPAVAEALNVKLAGLDGVTLLERQRIREILLAAGQGAKASTPAKAAEGTKGTGDGVAPSAPLPAEGAAPVEPDAGKILKLLGVEFLLTGTVQLVGEWPNPETKIRLSAKVVSSETAKIQGDAAFVADGTLKDFFGLETQLAEKFAKTMGKEAPALQIEYHEEKNLMALKLFGEGLLKLQEAEKLLGPLALDNPPAAPATPADAMSKEGALKNEDAPKGEGEPKKAP